MCMWYIVAEYRTAVKEREKSGRKIEKSARLSVFFQKRRLRFCILGGAWRQQCGKGNRRADGLICTGHGYLLMIDRQSQTSYDENKKCTNICGKEGYVMEKRMTWKEIEETYPDQWVGLTDVEWDKPGGANVVSAVVY